jgi:putative ABC transport system permease protein
MLKIVLRNVFRQRARSGLTLAAIALGVAGLLVTGGFVEDLLDQLRESMIHSELGHIQIYKRGQFASGGHRPLEFIIDDPATVSRTLVGMPGRVLHARRLTFSGLISNGRGALPVSGQGIEPAMEERIGSATTLLAGRRLAHSGKNGIMLGEGVALALNLNVGDEVQLVVNTREGAMNTQDFNVAGVFRSLSKEYDAHAVQIQLDAAQELLGTANITAFVVLLSDTRQTTSAAGWLETRLPSGLEVKTWRDLAPFYTSTEALYRRQFAVLQYIILCMVILSVANSVNMTLHERTPEFGIIRAMGGSGRRVFLLAVLEASVLGVIGATLGAVMGCFVAAIASAVGIPMPPPPNSESGFRAAVQVIPSILAGAFVSGVLATVIAALLPARHLARIPIVDALRRGV